MKLGVIIPITASLFQFGVAFFALNLGRRIKTNRVAWLLFSGLTLLAIASLLLPWSPFLGTVEWRVEAAALCAMTCVLLMIGTAHFDGRVKKLLRAGPMQPVPKPEAPSHDESPSPDAAAEMQQTITQLQSELAESKRTQTALEQNVLELRADGQRWVLANEELRQSLAVHQTERSDRDRAQELSEKNHLDQLAASRQAGMADATAPVLLHLKDVLNRINSLSLTADHLAKSRVAPLVQLTRTISARPSKSEKPTNGKSQNGKSANAKRAAAPTSDRFTATNNLPWIARELSAEQILLQRKIDTVKRKLESLNETLAIQQVMDKLSRGSNTEACANPAPDILEAPALEPALQTEEAPAPVPETPEPVLENSEESAAQLSENPEVSAPAAPLDLVTAVAAPSAEV